MYDYMCFFTEIQTYYFDIVITHELGCINETEDYPLCYKYQPITVWEDYINETSGNSWYIGIRDRIVLSGVNMYLYVRIWFQFRLSLITVNLEHKQSCNQQTLNTYSRANL